MKTLPQYITEYLIKKKINNVRTPFKYTPETKEELIYNIKELLNKNDTNLNCIDTSNITDMSHLFAEIPEAHKINFEVSEWDVSNVKKINGMFTDCEKFNCDLSNWDISNVREINSMFTFCKKFEGKGLEKWDVSKITNMAYLFANCHNFNCDLSRWDVSNVTDMSSMFFRCENFNCDLSRWDVSNVTTIYQMFYKCKKFTGTGLENWDVSNITRIINQRFAFSGCDKMKNKPSWYKG